MSVSEYDAFYSSSVQPFVDACTKFDETKNLGSWTETAFKHARNVIEASTQCKKASDADMMTFLGPIVKGITDAQSQDNRSPFFNQQKSYGEAIQCLNCLLTDNPRGAIEGALESAGFYLNKCLTVAKDKEDPEKTNVRTWVSTLKKMLADLATYFIDFHKTGLAWKITGADLSTYKPGEKADGGGQASGVEGRLEGLCGALEAHIAKTKGGDGDTPLCVSRYQEFYDESVVPFISASEKVCKKVGGYSEKAFKHLGVVIKATAECQKPEQEAFMKLLGPIVEVITESQNCDRGDTFNHEKAFVEAIQALNFVCMEGSPKPYILGQVEAGSFYSNKVLVAAKDKEDPEKSDQRAWVKGLKDLLTALAEYANEHCKMGLIWKPNGTAIADFKA